MKIKIKLTLNEFEAEFEKMKQLKYSLYLSYQFIYTESILNIKKTATLNSSINHENYRLA